MAQLTTPLSQATSSTPSVSTGTRSAADGFRRSLSWLRGLEGTSMTSWEVGAEQRWSLGGKRGGNQCRGSKAQVGWQQGLPIMAGISEHTSWGGLRVPHEEAGLRGAPDPLSVNPPCPLCYPPGRHQSLKILQGARVAAHPLWQSFSPSALPLFL